MKHPLSGWFFYVIINCAIPATLFYHYKTGNFSPHTVLVSAPISIFLGNLAVFMGLRFRDREQRTEQGNAGYRLPLWAVLAFAALVLSTALFIWLPTEKGGAGLMRDALSDKPISGFRDKRRATVVEFLRSRLKNSRDYERVACQLAPFQPALYSVESFSSKGEMEKKIEGVRKATSIDIEYYEKQVQAADAFKAKMRTIDPLFLEEFQGSHKRAETAQEEMLSVLEEWADATVDLYDSAMQKEGTFKVVEGNLVFTDGTSSAIFNDKLNRSQELLQLFKEKRELLVQEQNKFLEDLGVSKAAIGLKAK